MTRSISTHGDEPDLASLVARAKAGDAAALDVVCRRCYDGVLADFRQWIPSHAEDLTQQLFASLGRKLEGYEESGRFRAWLRGVAFNMFRTKRRSVERELEETLRTGMDAAGSETGSRFGTAKARLRELASRLPPSLRAAWDLHVQGYSHEEIGTELGITAGAATTRVSRARSMLVRWMMAGEPPEEETR